MSKPKAEKKLSSVRVTHVCVVGGIRREPGDYLVRDGELTDGVTDANLATAILQGVAEFEP